MGFTFYYTKYFFLSYYFHIVFLYMKKKELLANIPCLFFFLTSRCRPRKTKTKGALGLPAPKS